MNWRHQNIRLRRLEAEAIAIMREVVSEFSKPVLLYSMGKDSSALLHVAQKALHTRNQRPELWRLFNTRIKPGESMRVFPLSNWTELDVWEYIRAESIPVVPLYFAKKRPVVERDGMLIMIDDDRMPLLPREIPRMMMVRFRTLGCYPLTGAIASSADTLDAIIAEMRESSTSERQGRVIDRDETGSMEKKKREGYF